MKKIFSSLHLLFAYPFMLLKKTKIDNFVGGLVFGAIFSLIVNIVTVRVGEDIQKQRILEALENEILSNTLIASNLVDTNTKAITEKQKYNPFYSLQRYSRDLWTQSSEPIEYIAQLNQSTQIAVNGYYALTIPSSNRMLDSIENITYGVLSTCFPLGNNLTANETEECTEWYQILLESERSTAINVADEGFKILKEFHPTKDRLNSWFLRMLMGSESMRALSGK